MRDDGLCFSVVRSDQITEDRMPGFASFRRLLRKGRPGAAGFGIRAGRTDAVNVVRVKGGGPLRLRGVLIDCERINRRIIMPADQHVMNSVFARTVILEQMVAQLLAVVSDDFGDSAQEFRDHFLSNARRQLLESPAAKHGEGGTAFAKLLAEYLDRFEVRAHAVAGVDTSQ